MYEIPTDEIRLTDLVRAFKKYTWHLVKWFWLLLIFCIAFGYFGYWFAAKSPWSPPKYIANAAFNAVDSKSSASGIMALAGSFGLNLGSGSSNEVLMGIFKSRKVIKQAFLTDIDYHGKMTKMGNIYLDVTGLTEDFQESPILKSFRFTSNDIFNMSPLEDSLLSILYNGFVEDYMLVEYDPLAGMIKASIETPDLVLSKNMASKALQFTTEYYTFSQGDKNRTNYMMLSRKVDSLSFEIRKRETAIAANRDVNVFNKKQTSTVDQPKLQREISTLSMMYNEAVTSREGARSAMATTAPVMNIIDNPIFSTDPIYKKKGLWTVIGVIIGLLIGTMVLILQKAIREAFLEEQKEKESTSKPLVAS